jgi:hypothetical protein
VTDIPLEEPLQRRRPHTLSGLVEAVVHLHRKCLSDGARGSDAAPAADDTAAGPAGAE